MRVERARERLTHGAQALVRLATDHVTRLHERLARAAGHLDALSPLAVIARGYSVVRTADGLLVRSIADVPAGTPIQARMADGWLQAVTTGNRRQKLNEPDSEYHV